jgi:hypothetical protein
MQCEKRKWPKVEATNLLSNGDSSQFVIACDHEYPASMIWMQVSLVKYNGGKKLTRLPV